jgi:hypothetical protein
MTEAVVEFRDLRGANATGSVLNQPFPESIDQVPVLAASNFAGAFNSSFVGAKSYVLHMDLSLIHLFACKLPTRIHVAQFMHQRTILLYAGLPSCDHFQPVTKEFM